MNKLSLDLPARSDANRMKKIERSSPRPLPPPSALGDPQEERTETIF